MSTYSRIPADGRAKVLVPGTKVKWIDGRMDDGSYASGKIVSGPYVFSEVDRTQRIKLGWPSGPYHVVKTGKETMDVITSEMKVIT